MKLETPAQLPLPQETNNKDMNELKQILRGLSDHRVSSHPKEHNDFIDKNVLKQEVKR